MANAFEIQGTRLVAAGLKKAGTQATKLLAGALYEEGESIMAKSKAEAPVGVSGHGRASGFVRPPKREGSGIVVELGYGGDATYMLYQHEGTGPAVGNAPYMPPPDAFKDWARKFLGDEELAFVVARAVGQKGLTAKKFLEKPVREASAGMAQRVAARVRARMR